MLKTEFNFNIFQFKQLQLSCFWSLDASREGNACFGNISFRVKLSLSHVRPNWSPFMVQF